MKLPFNKQERHHEELLTEDKLIFDKYNKKSLRRKYNNFVNSLTDEEIIIFSTVESEFMFKELALYILSSNNDFKNTFERIEIEMLEQYYISHATEKQVEQMFAEDFSKVNKKFRDYCVSIIDTDKTKSLYNHVKLNIIQAWEKTKDHLNTIKNFGIMRLSYLWKTLKALGYTESKPYRY